MCQEGGSPSTGDGGLPEVAKCSSPTGQNNSSPTGQNNSSPTGQNNSRSSNEEKVTHPLEEFTSIHRTHLYSIGKTSNFSSTHSHSSGHGPLLLKGFPLDVNIKKISCGASWVSVLVDSGDVYTWGDNTYGQLGHGNYTSIAFPKIVDFFKGLGISEMSCGAVHGGYISENGNLYMMGCGTYGRLGLGNNETKNIPCLVDTSQINVSSSKEMQSYPQYNDVVSSSDTLITFHQISCGERHTLALSKRMHPLYKNQVFAWGDGGNGRLGIGEESDENLPILVFQFYTKNGVCYPDSFKMVSAGDTHSMALTEFGEVFTWGNGRDGNLGHQSTESSWVPHRIETLKKTKVVEIACGGRHSMALDENGSIYTWGRGASGQLGHGTINDCLVPSLVNTFLQRRKTIRKIAAGKDHSVVVDSDSCLYAWGENSTGQLGLDSWLFQSSPQNVPSLGIDSKGNPIVQSVLQISCGPMCTLVVTNTLGIQDLHATSEMESDFNTLSRMVHRNPQNSENVNKLGKTKECRVSIYLDQDLSDDMLPSNEEHYFNILSSFHHVFQSTLGNTTDSTLHMPLHPTNESAQISQVNFEKANFEKVNLEKVNLEKVNLERKPGLMRDQKSFRKYLNTVDLSRFRGASWKKRNSITLKGKTTTTTNTPKSFTNEGSLKNLSSLAENRKPLESIETTLPSSKQNAITSGFPFDIPGTTFLSLETITKPSLSFEKNEEGKKKQCVFKLPATKVKKKGMQSSSIDVELGNDLSPRAPLSGPSPRFSHRTRISKNISPTPLASIPSPRDNLNNVVQQKKKDNTKLFIQSPPPRIKTKVNVMQNNSLPHRIESLNLTESKVVDNNVQNKTISSQLHFNKEKTINIKTLTHSRPQQSRTPRH